MITNVACAITLAASALWVSTTLLPTGTNSPRDHTLTRVAEPDCGNCVEAPPSQCDAAEVLDPCHAWFPYNEPEKYSEETYHEHSEWYSIQYADDDCEPIHLLCDQGENDEEALAGAVEALEEAATFSEASSTLNAFQELSGVWVEFNSTRNALQVVSDGGCIPVPGGRVVEHFPVSEDLAEMWREVFLNQGS